ncbi:MAG: PEP-CTERM sorting domain-containing protein [Syntrophobacteraceae bacterium]
MRAAFILILLLALAPGCRGVAAPLESVPPPAVHANDSPAVSATMAGTAPTPLAVSSSPAASAVPGGDPVVGPKTDPLEPNLPKFPVEMFVREGKTSHFELFFLNVKYGYDLRDFEFYKAWCLKKGAPLPGHTVHTERLFSSFDPKLPLQFKRMRWHRINYLINHAKGSKKDMQLAIWHLAGCCSTTQLTPGARRLLGEADLKGRGYKPGAGDLLAIVLEPLTHEQPLFIEYKVPASVPPVVKQAIFTPFTSVGGFAGRFFIPPFFFFTSSHKPNTPSHTPPHNTPEPSSLLLLATGLLGLLSAWKAAERLECRRQLCLRPGGESRRALRDRHIGGVA